MIWREKLILKLMNMSVQGAEFLEIETNSYRMKANEK